MNKKFRVWNAKERYMQEFSEIGLMKSGLKVCDDRKDTEYEHYHLNDILAQIESEGALLQFTGLLDKTGKEIYESDIIEAEVQSKEFGSIMRQKGNIIFAEGCFCFHRNGVLLPMVSWNQATAEVIGNMFANPEILQPQILTKKE